MEMNSVEVFQGSFDADESSEHPISLRASDMHYVLDDHHVLPRVGKGYQVEVPPLIAATYCSELIDSPTNTKNTAGSPYDFLIGLPIPVMWIYENVNRKEHDSEVASDVAVDVANKNKSKKPKHVKQIGCDSLKLSAGPMNVKSDHRMSEMRHKCNGRRYLLVPGSSINSWSDIEVDSFLLGLYIFGKNLVQVKKFVGSKPMGDILSFYYGKFYRSHSYIRWTQSEKMRRKRGKPGEKLFTGLSQELLLSQLLPLVSEEDQTTLLEVSKTYQEGKMLLEEYASILKDKVGLSAFVQAVGIGKRKHDLTVLRKRTAPLAQDTPLANCGLVSPELNASVSLSTRSKMSKKRGTDEVLQAELGREKRVSSGPSATSSVQSSLVPFVNSIMNSVREPAKINNPIEQLQRSYAQASQVLFEQFYAYEDAIAEMKKESSTRAELEKERVKVKDLEIQLGIVQEDLEKMKTKVHELNAELVRDSGPAGYRYKAVVEHFKESMEFTQMKNGSINHGIIQCMNIMNAYFPDLDWKRLDGPPPADKDSEEEVKRMIKHEGSYQQGDRAANQMLRRRK